MSSYGRDDRVVAVAIDDITFSFFYARQGRGSIGNGEVFCRGIQFILTWDRRSEEELDALFAVASWRLRFCILILVGALWGRKS